MLPFIFSWIRHRFTVVANRRIYKANAEYEKISGCAAVPLENNGVPGTSCVHWSDACLNAELMTGFINLDVANPLSRISIASLEDMGYQVDYSTADKYGSSNLGAGCTCNRRMRSTMRNATKQGAARLVSLSTTTTSSTTAAAAADSMTRNGNRRRLSEEMRQYAVTQGLAFLETQKNIPASFSEQPETSGIQYVGDQVVSVIVQDGDDIFSVIVFRDS